MFVKLAWLQVFKIATSCCLPLNNYMVFNDVDGIYTYTYEAEKKEKCLGCSQDVQHLEIGNPNQTKLKDVINILLETAKYQMKSPGITAVINGKHRTLYMSTVAAIEEKTRDNLCKSLVELGIEDGTEVMVTDPTSPNTVYFKFKFPNRDVEMKD